MSGTCGAPVDPWEVAKQVVYGCILSAAGIFLIVLSIYYFCTKPTPETFVASFSSYLTPSFLFSQVATGARSVKMS